MIFCEECKYLPNCELAKHEEVDTCKKGKKTLSEQEVESFVAWLDEDIDE